MLLNERVTPLRVELPEIEASDIPVYTELFRRAWKLPEAFKHMYARTPDNEELSILSAACSIGAEVDSILALHNRGRHTGRIAIQGMDANPRAIESARNGIYRIPLTEAYPENELVAVRSLMRRFGFERIGSDGYAADEYVLKAEPVRRTHKVSFMEADLRKQIPGEMNADLVLANNILYWLRPEDATQIMANLAGATAPHGVLSVGDSYSAGSLRFQKMPTGQGVNCMPYALWLEQNAEFLAREFSFHSIEEGAGGLPIMFSRV